MLKDLHVKKVDIPVLDSPKPCEDKQGWIRGEVNIIEPL